MFQIKVSGQSLDHDTGLMAPIVFATSLDSASTEGQARALYAEMRHRFPANEGWTVHAYKVLQIERVVRDYTEVLNQPPAEILMPAPIQKGVI